MNGFSNLMEPLRARKYFWLNENLINLIISSSGDNTVFWLNKATHPFARYPFARDKRAFGDPFSPSF